MRKIFTVLSLSLIFIIAGCASQGNQALKNETEQSVNDKIIPYKTTKKEIQGMFGSPDETNFTDGGKEIWKYSLVNVSADAVSYIPIVNLFGSSASGTKKELVILFGKKDVVERFMMSESDHSTKTGVFR